MQCFGGRKPEGKRPLGRLSGRWKDNVIINLREIRLSGIDRINLAQDKDLWLL
jgi:hypothetical protein